MKVCNNCGGLIPSACDGIVGGTICKCGIAPETPKKERLWCAMCGQWGDHQSGTCPELKKVDSSHDPRIRELQVENERLKQALIEEIHDYDKFRDYKACADAKWEKEIHQMREVCELKNFVLKRKDDQIASLKQEIEIALGFNRDQLKLCNEENARLTQENEFLSKQCNDAFYEMTNGKISNPNTDVKHVITVSQDCITELVEKELAQMREELTTKDELLKSLKKDK